MNVRLGTARRRAAWGVVAVLSLAGAACGGNDDGDTGDPDGGVSTTAASGDPSPDAPAGDDELALGDPCELVPGETVATIVGGDVTAELANVGDGLPGATCTYTVSAGGLVSLSITPNGAGFYDGYKSQAEAAGEIVEVDGVGDEGFVHQDAEVVARSGETMIQLQVFTAATTADTGGVEIVKSAVAALGG